MYLSVFALCEEHTYIYIYFSASYPVKGLEQSCIPMTEKNECLRGNCSSHFCLKSLKLYFTNFIRNRLMQIHLPKLTHFFKNIKPTEQEYIFTNIPYFSRNQNEIFVFTAGLAFVQPCRLGRRQKKKNLLVFWLLVIKTYSNCNIKFPFFIQNL